MDKHHIKQLLTASGLDTPPYVVARRGRPTPAEVHDLHYPVFVKPARGGSSIGISKVASVEGLDDALAEAHQHDPKALVEEAVVGREIECGVLAGPDGAPEASVPAEVRITGSHTFYDFDAKYLEDSTEFDIPPRLDDSVIERVRA